MLRGRYNQDFWVPGCKQETQGEERRVYYASGGKKVVQPCEISKQRGHTGHDYRWVEGRLAGARRD